MTPMAEGGAPSGGIAPSHGEDCTASGRNSRVAVFCVGNRLLLDEGLGPAVYDELVAAYSFPENVDLFDVGCLGMELVNRVDEYDLIVTVDAVDNSGEAPGTVFEYSPDDMARRSFGSASLHELKLSDLFDAASLLGYEACGRCFGMQVQNMTPEMVTVGLTEPVYNALPLLVEAVLAYLYSNGAIAVCKDTGRPIEPGHTHTMQDTSTLL